MTGVLALTYDPVLARVRIPVDNAADNTLADAFGRDVVDGWGTADSGEAWSTSGGAAADYLTTLGVGRVVHGDVGTRRFTYAGAGWADVDLVGQITAPSSPTGAAIQAGYTVRFTDANNFYCALANFGFGGLVHVDLQKRVGGTITTLASTLDQSFSPGFRKWIRVRAVGGTLKAKLWSDGDPEPAAWGVTATDTDLTAGAVGTHSVLLTGNTNPLPVNIHFDNIAPMTLGTSAKVERSLTGSQWTTVRGAQARNVDGATSTTVDDYEFTPAVSNLYRVTLYDAAGATVATTDGAISPTITQPWLKNIAKPWLNRPVTVLDYGDVTRASRGVLFDVVGRTYPVAVTDVRGPRVFDLDVLWNGVDLAAEFDTVLSAGDVVYLQVPPDCPIPAGYWAVGDITTSRPSRTSSRRIFRLPLTEVAAPGPDVVGSAGTYQTVLNTYATYAELLAAKATYNDLAELVGSPTDVIVP